MSISVSTFSNIDLLPIVSLLKQNREALFPLLPTQTVAEVKEEFINDFIQDPLGHFLVAKDRKKNLIATIGMRTYDNRFEQLNFSGKRVVEVVKLYVHPTFRGLGLGSLIYKTLELEAFTKNIDQFYLHTHKFLPGAISFWEKQDFQKIYDQVGQWQTVHFSKSFLSHENNTQYLQGYFNV